MGLIDSLRGTIRAELTSADLAGSLQNINLMSIPVSNLKTDGELTAQFSVSRGNFKKIQKQAEKRGEKIIVLSRVDLIWTILCFIKRINLLAGIFIIAILSIVVPTRVFFVEVEGNVNIPTALILEVADTAGIRFGALRRTVRSEEMKNELLCALPQLQWAGVNTYGCTAVISVRERSPQQRGQSDSQISNVVASREGVITSCTATSGTCLCQIGQAVQKGETLISAYTDCKGVITVKRAEGEVFALTRRNIRAVSLSEINKRIYTGLRKSKFSICIGKKRINFYKGSGIYDGSCVKMVTQYQLMLPGGYKLPVVLIKEQNRFSQLQPVLLEEETQAIKLSDFSSSLLYDDAVSLSFFEKQEMTTVQDGLIILDGVYSCNEMIGRQQEEQIGDIHGKTG